MVFEDADAQCVKSARVPLWITHHDVARARKRMNLISDAEFIIVGGGAVGCGVAYSLAKAGQTDILLLEREPDVARVTTAQGAGLCGQVRWTVGRTLLATHSVATFRELQK